MVSSRVNADVTILLPMQFVHHTTVLRTHQIKRSHVFKVKDKIHQLSIILTIKTSLTVDWWKNSRGYGGFVN